MKKSKIFGLICAVMMFCVTILSGCSLITLDRERYLNQIVASIADKDSNKTLIEIKKKDLISAYNSFGYYYTQYYSYTAEEALKLTLDTLVDRRITILESEKIYSEGLSEAEKTYLWQETSTSLESNYKSYLDEVLGTSKKDDSSSDARKFEGYVKNAFLKHDGDSYEIIKSTTPSKTIENFKYDVARDINKKEDKDLLYTNLLDFVNSPSSDAYTKAFTNYLKALKKSEDGLNLSTDTASIFRREIERIYQVVYENYMIEKYDEYFTNFSDKASVTIKQMLDLYSSMVRSSYTQYNIEYDSAYETNMQSDSTKLYYYKERGKVGEENNFTQFFQVAHVLFKFTDAQSSQYKLLQERKANGYYTSEEGYNNDLNALISEVKPVVRQKNEQGEYVEVQSSMEEEKTALALARYIKNQVDGLSTSQDKVDAFREFIYKYNDDPGMINAANNYTIGVNKAQAENDDKYKVYSNYVTEFTDTAVELYNDGEGQLGDVSEAVITENGVHVLFYVGEIQNLFPNIDEKFALTNDDISDDGLTPIEKLAATRINPFVDKTYFDMLYDSLVTDNFSVFQNLNMNELKKQFTINYYPDAYKDLL